jgi:hypothetical protein
MASSIGGKCRRGEFRPGCTIVVGAMQLGAEMTVLERGINHAVGPQHIGDGDARKSDQARSPARTFALQREQPLARRYQ